MQSAPGLMTPPLSDFTHGWPRRPLTSRQDEVERVFARACAATADDNQPSVAYLLEWALVLALNRRPHLLGDLVAALAYVSRRAGPRAPRRPHALNRACASFNRLCCELCGASSIKIDRDGRVERIANARVVRIR